MLSWLLLPDCIHQRHAGSNTVPEGLLLPSWQQSERVLPDRFLLPEFWNDDLHHLQCGIVLWFDRSDRDFGFMCRWLLLSDRLQFQSECVVLGPNILSGWLVDLHDVLSWPVLSVAGSGQLCQLHGRLVLRIIWSHCTHWSVHTRIFLPDFIAGVSGIHVRCWLFLPWWLAEPNRMSSWRLLPIFPHVYQHCLPCWFLLRIHWFDCCQRNLRCWCVLCYRFI
jgi:hypothetical protein